MQIVDRMRPLQGELHLKVYKQGNIIAKYDSHNLVVNAGTIRVAELIAGVSTTSITHIGVGSGQADEDLSDTKMENQVLIPLIGRSANGGTAQFDFLIDHGDANGINISEFGLFFEDGVMFSHRLRKDDETGEIGVIKKMSDMFIRGYWIIKC